MARHWDEFARRDPYFYVLTSIGFGGPDVFYASGRPLAEEIVGWIGDGTGRGTAVEIGCGLGRVAVHVAAHFDRVDGVDVSREMLDRARAHDLPDNVHLHLGSGRDVAAIAEGSADLVYSLLVFQHIPDVDVIASYLRDVRRVLAPAGRAVIQLDTRPEHLLLRAYKALPDPLLPRVHRRYIRRYRRDPERVRELIAAAGLTVVDERDRASEFHRYLLAPA